MTHALMTQAQETLCRRCRCRWDFDDQPGDDDPCVVVEDARPFITRLPKSRQMRSVLIAR